VATFAIGEAGAANAGLFAVSTLANEDRRLRTMNAALRANHEQRVLDMKLDEI